MILLTRKAFTMVELVFVIAIIGILAVVAIPKMVATKDKATGSVCTHQVGQLINDITTVFMASGTKQFKDLNISTISNIQTEVGTNGHGIAEAPSAKVDTQGITYYCDGEPLMFMVGNYTISEKKYVFSITDLNPTRPASIKAAIQLRKLHAIDPGGTRDFTL